MNFTQIRTKNYLVKQLLLVIYVIFSITAHAAVTLRQVDDFQNNTLQNWSRGGVATQPTNVSTGGPAGIGDHFMRIVSDGSGNNGKMLAFNNSQWSGDFTILTSISVDLINLGANEVTMRLSFRDSTGSGGGGFLTDDNITLAPGSGWQTMIFDLSSLISVGTLVPASTFMTQVAQMRLIHAPQPFSLLGEEVVGNLGVDNIAAVPELAAAFLGSLGLLGLLKRRRS